MIDKITKWFKETGLTNVGYLAAGLASWAFVGGKFGVFIFGACVGLFVHFNYEVIKKLINDIK